MEAIKENMIKSHRIRTPHKIITQRTISEIETAKKKYNQKITK